MGIESALDTEVTLADEQANEILADKESLSALQENVENNPITSRDAFCSYLKVHGVDKKEFPLSDKEGLGKFLRGFRYYDEVSSVAKDKGIPLDYFFALMLTEGEGNATTINTADGGVGVLQIMPETFKRFCNELWEKDKTTYAAYHDYKVFYDQPKYASYKNKNNKAMADGLLFLKKKNKSDAATLAKIDSRFDPKVSLHFSAEYLLYCKSKVSTDITNEDTRRQYALNGYNKGPNNYDNDFNGSHLTNIKKRKTVYENFSAQLDACIAQKKTGAEILEQLKPAKKILSTKTPLEKKSLTPKKIQKK